ncbi:MAG: hypothetical protein I8H91_04750 [Burkholderiales bacterium]|nr:hypothetical protein [Burkholderiales bacterium]
MLYLIFPIVAISYIYSVQSSGVQKFETTPYNLTDNNWVNGVGINTTCFFINNSRENFNYYQVGKLIKFSTGDTRQIIRVEQTGAYLNIYVNGQPLDGEKVGFPNKIEIVK